MELNFRCISFNLLHKMFGIKFYLESMNEFPMYRNCDHNQF